MDFTRKPIGIWPTKFLHHTIGRLSLLSVLLLLLAGCGTFEVKVEDISDVGARVTINEVSVETSRDSATIDEVKAEAFGADDDEGVKVAAAPTDVLAPTDAPEPTKIATVAPTAVPTSVPTTVPPTAVPVVATAEVDTDGERATTAKADVKRESAGSSVSVDVTASRSTAAEGDGAGANLAEAGMACFATGLKGLSCLTPAGEWQTFTEENSPLTTNRVGVLEACPDGSMLIGSSGRILRFDGAEWTEYEYLGWVPTAFHCMNDGFWVGHNKGVAYFDDGADDGSKWTEYDSETIAPGQSFGSANDVTVDAAGRVWVVTHATIAKLDGGEWTIYTSDADLAGLQSIQTILVDRLGRPVAQNHRAFFLFEDDTWTVTESPMSTSIRSMDVDQQNRLWVSGGNMGINVLSQNEPVNYRQDNSELTSSAVHAVAFDTANRAWIGTQWGLNILDGEAWQSYHMDTSALLDHDIKLIAVAGSGPTLPERQSIESGTLTGRIMLDAQPQADVQIEACVEPLMLIFDGDTPCSEQQVFVTTATGADGWFTFDDLPQGAYIITYKIGEEWGQIEDQIGGFSARIPVQAGEQTYLGEILLRSAE